jgi:TetR/AcrR family transcriptional repressor of nem operon
MRYPKLHKELSRRKIVKAAAKAFNRRGLDGIGIADIMKEAGLTQGAFSGHFSSKDELIREAIDDAFHLSVFEQTEWKDRPLADLIQEYVSVDHRDNIEDCCPATTLTSEVARRPRRTREKFLTHLSRVLSSIESRLPGNIPGPRRQIVAMSIFALLVGSVQLSRVTRGTKLSDAMINAAIKGATTLIER